MLSISVKLVLYFTLRQRDVAIICSGVLVSVENWIGHCHEREDRLLMGFDS